MWHCQNLENQITILSQIDQKSVVWVCQFPIQMYKNKNMLTPRCPWTTWAHSEMTRFTKSTIVDCKMSNGERRQFTATYIIGWLSIGCTTCTNKSRWILSPYKGTVRTPSVASGHGYCLQTAHLESQRWGHFVRSSAPRPNYGDQEGPQPQLLQAHTTLALLLCLNIQLHRATLHGGSRILRNKLRLVAPFYDKYVYIWFYLVLQTVTHYPDVGVGIDQQTGKYVLTTCVEREV